jgi:hypothetical protein
MSRRVRCAGKLLTHVAYVVGNVLPHKEPVALSCILEGAPRFGALVYRNSRAQS